MELYQYDTHTESKLRRIGRMEEDIRKKYLKKFVKFLKYNDAYANYRYNFQRSYLRNSHYLFNQCVVSDWILLAFDWESSNEGLEFWQKLNRKWRMEISIQ